MDPISLSNVPGLLPAELWANIFLLCHSGNILALRRTCRHWKALVDQCATLGKRLTLYFVGIGINQLYEPRNLLPAGGVCLVHSEVDCVDRWWIKLGQRLAYLSLENCKTNVSCPRVRTLRLKSDTVDDVVVLEMCHRLPQLVHLTLESGSITDASADYLLKQNDTLQTLRIVAPWGKFTLAARDKLEGFPHRDPTIE